MLLVVMIDIFFLPEEHRDENYQPALFFSLRTSSGKIVINAEASFRQHPFPSSSPPPPFPPNPPPPFFFHFWFMFWGGWEKKRDNPRAEVK